MFAPPKACVAVTAFAAMLSVFTPAAEANKPIPAGAVGLAKDVGAQAEAHDWKALLDRCEPGHRKTQKDMGMAEAQYIAEMLGLHRSGNNIKRGKTLTYKDLGRIRSVVIEKLAWSGPWIAVTGKVTLEDGKVLSLSMMITKAKTRFYLTGAVG